MSFYPVYACPTHPGHEVSGLLGPPDPRWCGMVNPAVPDWPCRQRMDIVRWTYDPTQRDPKPGRRPTVAAWVLGCLGIWAVIAFGALCILVATRSR